MDLKLLVTVSAVYATNLWSIGNLYPFSIHQNMLLDKMDVSDKVKYTENEYPDSIKDMIPTLERKSRELGIVLDKY